VHVLFGGHQCISVCYFWKINGGETEERRRGSIFLTAATVRQWALARCGVEQHIDDVPSRCHRTPKCRRTAAAAAAVEVCSAPLLDRWSRSASERWWLCSSRPRSDSESVSSAVVAPTWIRWWCRQRSWALAQPAARPALRSPANDIFTW